VHVSAKVIHIDVEPCNMEFARNAMAKQTGFDRLAQDCGVEDLVVRQWVERIRAVMPHTGYGLDLPALFSETAPGVTAAYMRKPKDKKAMLKFFQKVQGSNYLDAAIWDLLVGNCDRHGANIFIDDHGKLTLIDHDMALTGKCISNSLFLPSTYFANKLTLGGSGPFGHTKGKLSVVDVMDYRCHTKKGALDTDYPRHFQKCLKQLSKSSLAEITSHYNFPVPKHAYLLKMRAEQMLTWGFEWTLFESGHIMGEKCPKRFPMRKPCCSLEVSEDGHLECGDRSRHEEQGRLPPSQECHS